MTAGTRRARIPHVEILALLAVAEFMLTLDLSIVNVALPAIRGLGFGEDSLQWVVNGYALTFGGFLLLGGRAADLFGGRRVFLGALSVFSAASLACGLAGGEVALVAARAVQGLSAGVLAPATLSLLTATWAEPAERNRALSVWTAVAIGGGAVGALAGGILTDALSWRWIFFVNVPVGAALVALGAARLPRRDTGTERGTLDVAGAITVTAGITALVWALVRTEAAGGGSREVVAGLAAAAVLLGAFVVVETRLARAPLVPFAVFRSRRLSAGNLLSFLSFVPVMATWFLLTLYLQRVRAYTPIEAGLIFLPMALAVIGGSQVSFRAVARVDARVLFAAGGLVAAVGMAWLGRLSESTAMPWVLVPACIAMAGGGLMFAPVTVAATSGAPADQGGLASGLLNTTRQIGGALGLAVLGTVAAAQAASDTGGQAAALSAGTAAALTAGAAIFIVTAIAGALALPSRLAPPDASGRDDAPAATPRSGAPRGDAGAAARLAGRPCDTRATASPPTNASDSGPT
jgi:EmrB/QacA subfamily drug resistance transporter